jgi:hypothetical protein
VKTGDLVKYIPSPSASFKWQNYVNTEARNPGIIMREVESKGVATKRFQVRWHNGKITEEWVSSLEPLTFL